MHAQIITIIKKAVVFAMEPDSQSEAFKASREDFNSALSRLDYESRDKNKEMLHRITDLITWGDAKELTRMQMVGELENATPGTMPGWIVQAVEYGVPAKEISQATGLSLKRIETYTRWDELSDALLRTLDADTTITLLEDQLATAREERSQHARQAIEEGATWYRVAQVVGRTASTVERWQGN